MGSSFIHLIRTDSNVFFLIGLMVFISMRPWHPSHAVQNLLFFLGSVGTKWPTIRRQGSLHASRAGSQTRPSSVAPPVGTPDSQGCYPISQCTKRHCKPLQWWSTHLWEGWRADGLCCSQWRGSSGVSDWRWKLSLLVQWSENDIGQQVNRSRWE